MALDSSTFYRKLLYNLVVNWAGGVGQDGVIKEAMDREVFGSEWTKFIQDKRDAYSETLEEEERKFLEYRQLKTFLTTEDMAEAATIIGKNYPSVLEPWKITNNATSLGEMLELTPNETLILDLAIRQRQELHYKYSYVMQKTRHDEDLKNFEKRYSVYFGIDAEEMKVIVKGFLFRSGILSECETSMTHQITNELRESLCMEQFSLAALEETLFPNNLSTQLTTDQYPHIAKEISRTEKIINNSLENRARGTNVMLWGLPGTGKTELVLAMAQANGWDVKAVGDISDEDNKEKSRAERLTSLKLAMKLFQRRDKTILLFDEMEDLFKMDTNAQFSKAFINRIIETATMPIVWTTNDLRCIGSAALRRMVYNIGFEIPPVASRRIMWAASAKKYSVELSEEVINNLAETFDTVPALINNAVKISSMAQLESGDIPEIISSLDRLMNLGEVKTFKNVTVQDTLYDASCANTDMDLDSLTQRLKVANPGFSLCLYGAPGTGKSEYGRYLAKALGKKVLFKRASDLQSMWVGQCEKNIAAAFKEAADNEQVLIIDEGDSFLQDRTKARASWEISQVNEMLSQMENHPQPFIITTNLMDNLDAASLRRFTFKMKFDFMRSDQSIKLFNSYFKVQAPTRIERLEVLAPGDFAVVQKKVRILGIQDPQEILKMLEQECELKPHYNGAGGMGFGNR